VQYYCPQKNHSVVLSPAQKIGGGGEGSIYVVTGMPNVVAKVFHHPTLDQLRKLELMLALPCNPQSSGTPPVAWPEGLLFRNAKRERFSGYLMPRVTGACPAIELYNPKSRRAKCPGFNYRYLHRAALNISYCCRLAHERGFVIGDLNESTFLVRDNGCVTMVDSESMQMRDATMGRILRCRVGKPDFTPAELQGKNLKTIVRTADHDHFALGVLLFRLLMEGVHPFDGIFRGVGIEVPSLESRIAAGHFPYGTRAVPWAPKRLAPDFTMLHPELRQLFLRCFDIGHFNPKTRPDSEAWVSALRRAEQDLVKCTSNPQHWHGRHLNGCPWCDRARVLGFDPFPNPSPHVPKHRTAPQANRRLIPLAGHLLSPTLVHSGLRVRKPIIQSAVGRAKPTATFGIPPWLIAVAIFFLFVIVCAISGDATRR
jgi:DNA-binding helix-hairpin-helix protein with protein kinase domain